MPTPSTALVPLRAALLAMLLVVGTCAALLFGHALEAGHGGPAAQRASLSAAAVDGVVAVEASAVSASSAVSAAPSAPDDGGEGLLALCLGVGCAIVLLLAGVRLRAAPLRLARRLGGARRHPRPRPLDAPAPAVALDAIGISRT